MSISRVLAVIACLVAVVAVVACGDDDDDDSSADTTEQSTTEDGGGSSSELPDLTGQKAVFVNYGGASLDTAKKAWLEPFSEETGAEMTGDSPSDFAKVKAMVQSGNVTWDLIDIDGGSGATGCGKEFATREELGVDVSQIDPKYLSDECGVPIIVTTTALLYNKEKYKDNPPTKITDFLDTENFPGRRATFNYAIYAWENLLLASGVAPDKLYPYDYERAEAAYEKIKDDLVLQDTLAQQAEQLASGNFDMCFCLTGRAAITPGVSSDKIGIVWQHAWVANDVLYAINGSKVPDLQAAFMNYVAQPEVQNAFTELQPYGPATSGPPPAVPEKFKYWMPEFNEDKTDGLSYIDYKYLSEPGVSDEANARWTSLTSG
jgi:putative spermidine/putrescine transport system substrate-binding protein